MGQAAPQASQAGGARGAEPGVSSVPLLPHRARQEQQHVGHSWQHTLLALRKAEQTRLVPRGDRERSGKPWHRGHLAPGEADQENQQMEIALIPGAGSKITQRNRCRARALLLPPTSRVFMGRMGKFTSNLHH